MFTALPLKNHIINFLTSEEALFDIVFVSMDFIKRCMAVVELYCIFLIYTHHL